MQSTKFFSRESPNCISRLNLFAYVKLKILKINNIRYSKTIKLNKNYYLKRKRKVALIHNNIMW